MKLTGMPIVMGALGTILKGLLKELEDIEIKRTGRNHQDYSIIKIGQNTEKSPGDLRKLAVAQIPVKCSSNTDVKSSQRSEIIIIIY